MDAVTPKCPSCSAPVQPDWDWCQLCGYDPESLMPAGWISPALYQAEASGGGTGTATKRRRAKRGRKADAEVSAPPPLIQLPENLVAAVDPITDERARPASPPPVAVPSLSPTGFDAAPAPAAGSNGTAANDAAPAKKARTRDKGRGRSAKTAPVPTTPRVGAPAVYRVKATPPEMIGAGVLLAAAAGLAYLTVRGILQVATGASTSALDNVATVVFVVLCAVVAFACAAQGAALVRQRVEVDADELVAHNRFGRVQRVPVPEIYAIRLSQRQFATPRGLSQPIETPYVQRGDGSGFWLDALGGRSPGEGPSDAQLALFEQLTAEVDRLRPPRPVL
jgi:hypothetical protein